MTEADKISLVNALHEKLPTLECPMCHKKKFALADGYISNVLQDNLEKIKLDGTCIPTAAIICEYCGFVSFHALGNLGSNKK